MSSLCDLHAHSYFSDGTFSPTELLAEAERIGLDAVVLSDHNTIRGLDEFIEAAKGSSVEAIPAVEFSTDYQTSYGKTVELHIVALYIKHEHHDSVNALVRQMAENKAESNRALVATLREHGYDITYDEVCATSSGNVNRAHIAAVLTDKGYTPSIRAAFQDLLAPDVGLYIPPKRLPVFEAIEYMRSIGAVPVLAHPFLQLDEAELRIFLSQAKSHGLVGMETLYSTYDEDTITLSRAIAHEYGLCESGGSDFHGGRKPDISLGTGRGNLAIPYEFLDKLKAFAG